MGEIAGVQDDLRPEVFFDRVILTLNSYRFTYDNEIELQDAIEVALTKSRIPFEREARLGKDLRIDFLVAGGIGIEAKIKGSPSEVARQLLSYANRPEISCLVLITGRAALGRLPGELLGKRLLVIPLWRTFL